MPCFPVLAPPTLNTVTATHAIPPIFSINESDYKVKRIFNVMFFICISYSFLINIIFVISRKGIFSQRSLLSSFNVAVY